MKLVIIVILITIAATDYALFVASGRYSRQEEEEMRKRHERADDDG